MNLQPVESSNITAIGHEGTTLAVQFAGGGLYHYDGVSKEAADKLKRAKSIGGHFAEHIRPKFKGIRKN